MQDAQTDAPDGVQLIGGEMPSWSDLDRLTEPGVIAEAAAAALPDEASNILLIGPWASALLPDLAGRTVDVLVRGVPDAQRITGARSVLCGALDRLTADAAYDVVVVLDPPETVLSPDSPGMSHTDALGLAADALAPGGTLIALLPNEIALDRLTPREHVGEAGDDAWWVGTQGYDLRRPFHSDLRTILADAGLHLWAGRSVLPSLTEPLVVLNSADDDANVVAVQVLAHHAYRVDGALTAIDAVESGAVRELATAWLLVAGHTPDRRSIPEVVPAFAPEDALETHRLPLLRALKSHNLDRVRVQLAAYQSDAGSESRCAAGLLDLADQVQGQVGAHPFAPELDTQAVASELAVLVDLPQTALDKASAASPYGRRRGRTIPRSPEAAKITALESSLTESTAKVSWLQRRSDVQERRIRALEHAIATGEGSLPRRALFVMTAPTHRIVEAARARLPRR